MIEGYVVNVSDKTAGSEIAPDDATFNPTSITGCNLWLDANQLALANNDPVGTWTDLSSGGFNLTEATNKPTFKTAVQNGLPGVQFDGTNDILSNAGFSADASATMFVVLKATSTPAGNLGAVCRISADQSWIFDSSTPAWNHYDGTTVRAIKATAVTTTALLEIKTTSTSSVTTYYNQGDASTFDPADAWTTSTGIRLGASNALAAFFAGTVFEVIHYDSALSDTDRATVESYLGGKWGLGFGTAALKGATSGNSYILVQDLTDFDTENGGTLNLYDGTNYAEKSYAVPTGSTSRIDLGSALSNTYAEGTPVKVISGIGGKPFVERWADIREPDAEELLRCLVPHHLRPLVRAGQRDEDATEPEMITAHVVGEDLVVQNVIAVEPTGVDLKSGASDAQAAKDRIRWTARGGNLVGDIFAFENNDFFSVDSLEVASYPKDSGYMAQLGLAANSDAAGTAGGKLLLLSNPDTVYVLAGGNTYTLIDEDGFSDWQMAASAAVFSRDTSTSVTSGAAGAGDVKATLDSTSYDVDPTGSSIADLANDRFVVRTAGIYIISWQGVFASNTTGDRWLSIYINGASDRYSGTRAMTAAGATETDMTIHRSLAVNDTVEFYYAQNSGSTLTCSGDANMAWVSSG